MQIEQQNPTQADRTGKRGNPNWRKGVSGNPSGQTRRQRHYAALSAEFVRVRGRDPGTIERGLLSNCAALQAKLDGGADAEQTVRMNNVLSRLLGMLRLADVPDPPPKSPIEALRDYCGGKGDPG